MRVDIGGGGRDVVDGDAPPVFAVDPSVDDEAVSQLSHVERPCSKKLAGIEEVAARAAGDERGELARRQLMVIEEEDSLRGPTADGVRVARRRCPQRRAEHEVEVDLDAAGTTERRGV